MSWHLLSEFKFIRNAKHFKIHEMYFINFNYDFNNFNEIIKSETSFNIDPNKIMLKI